MMRLLFGRGSQDINFSDTNKIVIIGILIVDPTNLTNYNTKHNCLSTIMRQNLD